MIVNYEQKYLSTLDQSKHLQEQLNKQSDDAKKLSAKKDRTDYELMAAKKELEQEKQHFQSAKESADKLTETVKSKDAESELLRKKH